MKAIVVELLLLIVTAIGCTFIGHHYGEQDVQAKWDAQKIVDAEATAKAIKESNDKVRAIEQAANSRVYQVSANYEAKLRKKDNEKTTFIICSFLKRKWIICAGMFNGPYGNKILGRIKYLRWLHVVWYKRNFVFNRFRRSHYSHMAYWNKSPIH